MRHSVVSIPPLHAAQLAPSLFVCYNNSQRYTREYAKANLSTQTAQARPHTRLHCPQTHHKRQSCSCAPSPQRSGPPCCVAPMFPRRRRVPGEWFAQQKKQPCAPLRREPIPQGEILIYPPLSEATPRPRVGVVIPKRAVRTSVERHRAKRRVYAAVAHCASAAPPAVYLIRVGKEVLSARFHDLVDNICRALVRKATNSNGAISPETKKVT